MSFDTPDVHLKFPSMNRPCLCTHSRMISNCGTEEEHNAGMVRCVECGSVIPDPHPNGRQGSIATSPNK